MEVNLGSSSPTMLLLLAELPGGDGGGRVYTEPGQETNQLQEAESRLTSCISFARVGMKLFKGDFNKYICGRQWPTRF